MLVQELWVLSAAAADLSGHTVNGATGSIVSVH
jgi:hypothetical protein